MLAGITKAQVKAIHAAKSALRMDDDTYRLMLSEYGVGTSLRLDMYQAADLLTRMSGNSQRRNAPQQSSDRPGMATGKQLGLIVYKWDLVSRAPESERRKALDTFLGNHFGISRLEWLPRSMVGKVIKTMESMAPKTEVSNG